jgi:hypothetical protein
MEWWQHDNIYAIGTGKRGTGTVGTFNYTRTVPREKEMIITIILTKHPRTLV